jgi:hypothetical protein
MTAHVPPEDDSGPARPRRPILSVAHTWVLGLGKRAYGAMVWYINIDGKDEREALSAKSRCATRDLVREAMLKHFEPGRNR